MTSVQLIYAVTLITLCLLTAYGLYPLFSDAASDVVQVFIPMPTRES